MIYLTTGANGAGKTLLTLRDVREKSIKESRPVYYNGRFDMVEGGELSSWQKIDIKDWQSIPDGAIFVVDECHNDFPIRSGKESAPEYVRMLAEHRKRGFDFYLISQHPLNIDAFVRRLIGSPGWHRHLKRSSGAPLVSVLQWPSVNEQCQKVGSGESGEVQMVTYPKEVYQWYNSTSLDTAKVKIPYQVKVLAVCLLLVPVLGYFGYQSFFARLPGGKPDPAKAAVSPNAPGQVAPVQEKKPMSPAEYAQTFQPRIEGLAYTAVRYDEQTRPATVPYPAACLQMGDRCECFSQQATKLQVPKNLCAEIVKGGFFVDWAQALRDSSPKPSSDKQVLAKAG